MSFQVFYLQICLLYNDRSMTAHAIWYIYFCPSQFLFPDGLITYSVMADNSNETTV